MQANACRFLFLRKTQASLDFLQNKKPTEQVGFTFSGDLAGARTQDPLLKREMLYQLSYQVIFVVCIRLLCIKTALAGANILSLINFSSPFKD
jgi:hypothetical protein